MIGIIQGCLGLYIYIYKDYIGLYRDYIKEFPKTRDVTSITENQLEKKWKMKWKLAL